MIPFFPKQISNRAIIVYLISIVTISLVYSRFAMPVGYIVLGLVFILGFFLITNYWTKDLGGIQDERFLSYLFFFALSLRLVWVVGSYYYYISATGSPFGYENNDAVGYHETALWLAESRWSRTFDYFFRTPGVPISDAGYPIWLTIIYKVFGPNILIPRLFKALISTWMCILIYKISIRTFGERTGRMAGVMSALMPNFIIYCGYHLKEIEMIFLEVAFLERLDFLLRSKKVNFWVILLTTFLALSLFLFRTVLGAVAIFTAATAVLVSSSPALKVGWRRFALIAWGILCIFIAGSGTILTEIEGYWAERGENATMKRYEQTLRGNLWAKYATGTVMAPMAFVLPFSTMVNVDEQYGQQEKHSGNFIRNFMGFFTLLAIYEALRRKKWRDFVLLGAFVISYLGIVSTSGFSNSERFLLPALPVLIMMWAYGISVLRAKTYKLLTPWCFIVFAMEFAWAYFKLGSRGLF